MSNSQGKTLTIFVILIIVLLASSTSIGFFLYKKESTMRMKAEADRDVSQTSEMKLQADLKEVKRQLVVLEDKNKEADDKINNLMDEMELNDGLRKELKTENASVKDALDAAKKDKEKLLADLDESRKRYKEIMELFKVEQDKSAELSKKLKAMEEAKAQVESKLSTVGADLRPYDQRTPEEQISSEVIPPGPGGRNKVELDKIVVNPNDGTRGRVLSVDKDAEFLVCSLGLTHGIKNGDIISVYRGSDYLGDVRVTRVQQELSAADIIPPFSSRKVRKNDTVVFKP